MRLLVAIAVTLVGCRTGDAPGGVAVAPAGAAPASVSAAAAASAPPRCTPSLPEPPPGGPAVEGPAYVVVDGVGVLRITEGRVSIVLPRADASSWDPEVALGPTGELWLSDWDGITVLAADGGEFCKRRLDRDGTRPERMTVLAARDVWAVTSDSEWDLVRFDGRHWGTVRRRAQFPGKFDDNKIEALAVTSAGVWVSTWNGLWRGVGDDWRRIDPPEGVEAYAELWVYRDQLIAGYVGGHLLRDGETWRALDWPVDASVRRAVGDVGLVVAPRLDGPTVLIGAVEGGDCIATSDPVHGSHVHAFTIDGAGRVWVATEEALAVLDGSGRVLTEWTAGTLEGLTGRIRAVAVVGAGPKQLPAVRPARMWEIVGRLETHKGSTPLANTAIELCGALSAQDQCAQTSFRRATTTAADGSFRFADVPEGELHMVVHPPAELEDCSGIFSESGHTIAPARDCHGTADAPLRCDLGTLTECLPFEMPPPPH
jgi:hypothetical protein